MSERLAILEARLEALSHELVHVRQRLAALESAGRAVAPTSAVRSGSAEGAPAPRSAAPAAPAADRQRAADGAGDGPARWVTLAGRSLIVLGGAYLLRAVGDAGLVPAPAAIAAGLLYAAMWLIAAARAQHLSASFHGVTAALVAVPLIWETSATLGVLPPWAAAAALTAFAAAALVTAARRDLVVVAATATIAVAGCCVALVLATHDTAPGTVASLSLLAMVAWLGAHGRWTGLLWVPALAADVLVLHATLLAARVDVTSLRAVAVPPAVAVLAGLALVAISLATTAVRTLVRREPVDEYDLVQTVLALVVGAGGAARVLTAHGAAPAPIGLLLLLLGAGATATAFSVLRLRPSSRGTTLFYATCGAVLVVGGASMILRGTVLALVLALAAVAATVVARGPVRRVLLSNAAVLLAAAGMVSGLLAGVATRLLGSAAWQPLSGAALGVAGAIGVCFVYLWRHPPNPGLSWLGFLPRAAIGALAVWTAGGLALEVLGSVLRLAAEPAALATARTLVLVAGALACAAAVRGGGPRELGWFVAPILAGGGLKLLLEDLQHGRALTLFVSLGLYGLALIVVPRLLRRPQVGAAPEAGAVEPVVPAGPAEAPEGQCG